MSIQLRQSALSDALAIADFSRKSFYEGFAHQNTEENMEKFMLRFSRTMLAKEVQDPENVFILAVENDSIVGYLKMVLSKNPEVLVDYPAAEIARIYVDQKIIGQGVGSRLMQRALALLHEKAIDTAWLGVWEYNASAIRFYTKCGFTKFGEHIFMLGDDPQTDWLMKKALRDPKA